MLTRNLGFLSLIVLSLVSMARQAQAQGPNTATSLATPLVIPLKESMAWSGLTAAEASSISRIHKPTRTMNFLFSEDNRSWLYDQSLDNNFGGSIIRLEKPVAIEPEARFFTMQSGNFWMLGPSSIVTRKRPLDPGMRTVQAMRLTPAFQTAKTPGIKLLYVDNFRMIFSNDTDFYVVEKTDNASILYLNLAIPEGSRDKPFVAAGVGEELDQFWLARQNEIYFLAKKDDTWNWTKAALQIQWKGQALTEPLTALGLVINFGKNGPALAGAALAKTANAFMATEKLTPLYLSDDDMIQIGNNLVKTQITEKCMSCHPDFSLLSGIRAKAAAIEKRVDDRTMPPPNSPPLGTLERAAILRWIRMGFIPQ